MSASLLDKTAIVTGASRGLGKGIAIELAKRGANIVITYNAASKEAESVSKAIEDLGSKVIVVHGPGTDPNTPQAVVRAAVEAFGKIDIIVNNAGTGDDCLLKDLTHELYDKILATNLKLPAFLLKAALPHLGASPRVVNISSIAARAGPSYMTAYASSKAALEGATRVWASELGKDYNVTVNCVNPGPIATDMWLRDTEQAVLDEWDVKMKETPAAPRIATVDDVAQIVAFLCEEGSRWCTGSVVNANGGLLFV